MRRPLQLCLALAAAAGCSRSPSPPALTGAPLHLEERLAGARIEGSAVPADLPRAVAWRFDRPQPAWQAVVPLRPGAVPVRLEQGDGGLRIALTEAHRQRFALRGTLSADLPGGWNRQDWAFVAVRARATGPAGGVTLWFNRRERPGDVQGEQEPFLSRGERAVLVADGAAHTYLLRADWSHWWTGPPEWRQLGLDFNAWGPATVELLSVEVIPKEARYAEAAAGVVTEPRAALYRRALYTHAPGKVSFRLRVPPGGRLDAGLGVLRDDAPVTFRVTVAAGDGPPETAFEEAYADREGWGQRSVDLSRWAGETVTLGLETAPARGGRPGTVALWAAPTVSGERQDRRPNVILYVIDAAGAEYMSAYGYSRRTTPNLERLAGDGVLFERAYSNSTWSKPSTTSFMTGLQNTVLGNFRGPADPLPERAETMAQRFHRAGWQTAVMTSNAWCGTMSSLERGVDVLRESIDGPGSASAAELQAGFWRWRDDYPGAPYWVHFQTTDVHWPWEPVAPVAGRFLPAARREELHALERRLGGGSGGAGRFWGLRSTAESFARAGVDRGAYFELVRDAYDEAVAYADSQLGRLVEVLKARGEWERTLLIVTADHGDWPGLGLFPAGEAAGRVPFLNPYLTRVPLVVVWPEKLPAGRRVAEPVSLLDLLPTVLELSNLPRPELAQGQSLVPLLLGKPGWQPRPVVLDETEFDPRTGATTTTLEVIDGRWGASLALTQGKPAAEAGPPLLLYDLWIDPYTLKSLHRERPDLAKKYTALLERTFREHRALARRFTRKEGGALDSRQLETLKSLGYIN